MIGRIVIFAALVWAALMGPGFAAPAQATSVLVMGEDADADSVPRSSRVFRRVLDGLNERLTQRGYQVVDEVAATLGTHPQGRKRRTDAELLDVARSASAPSADVVLVFTLYSHTEPLKYSTLLRSRLSGRLIAVRSGESLGSFDVAFPRDRRLPYGCKRDCLLEAATKQAGKLADELGRDVAKRLEGVEMPRMAEARPDSYALIIDGFATGEVELIVDYLTDFEGHHDIRFQSDSGIAATYALDTFSDWPALKWNFTRLMEHLDIPARIHAFEREIRLERTKLPPG